MTYVPTEKIRVFVSSRLEECAEEREIARSAIESINCEPIMFEAAGARPHPPRSIYLKGVDDALFFVGIYKEGYGYIADGMDVSGLEDEYRYSRTFGKPQLLYVKKDCKREGRLESLISEFTGSSITVAFYESPDDLYELLRDNITALISGYVFRGLRSYGPTPVKPGAIVEELVGYDRLLRRTQLETKFLETLKNDLMVVVSAPLGAGKTVFLADMANRHRWAYVQCEEKTPREVLVESADAVRAKLGIERIGFGDFENAKLALKAGWQALKSVVLVLDGVLNAETATAVINVIKFDKDHLLIVSTRQSDLVQSASLFNIPPLGLEEIRQFVKMSRAEPLIPGELDELATQSEGNPLYLRYYTAGKPRHFERTIAEYELKAWQELGPRSREALSYIALSMRALSLEELFQLMGSEGGIQDVSDSLTQTRNLIVESDQGFSIFHLHAKENFRGVIAKSQQLLKFFSNRLAKRFSKKHDYMAAFDVLDRCGLDIPLKLLEMATRQAAVQGYISFATRVSQILIKKARDSKSPRLANLMAGCADILGLAGKNDEALQMLHEVRNLDAASDLSIPVDEIELRILAWAKSDSNTISDLSAIKQRYIMDGRTWDAARVALDLSASLIRRGDYPEAAEEAQFALNGFSEHDDAYGVKIAKLNLLSVASAIPEKSEIAARLLKECEGDPEITLREKAALCNVLTRLARENNDIESAKAYAREAIRLGRGLGDVSIVCNNIINLGNVFRQEGKLEEALEQYGAADKIARDSDLLQSEAWVQKLTASVLNGMGDGRRAMHHARYAIGLVKGGLSRRTEVEAYEELAEACELVNDSLGAREAWIVLAGLELRLQDRHEEGIYAFLRAARLLYEGHARKAYIKAYRELFALTIPEQESLSDFEILVNELQDILSFMPDRYAFEAAVYHARLIFDRIPQLLARQAYLQLMRQLSGLRNGVSRISRLRAALAVSMALSQNTLAIGDIVQASGYLARRETGLSFRAHSDGAVHLAVNLDFGKPVMVTISQLDDRPDVSLVSLCIALALLSFAEEISEEVFAGIKPARSEGYIYVVDYHEAKEQLPLERAGLESMENTCAVTRAADIRNDPGPIVVITRADLTKDWLVGGGQGNSAQILFAEVLRELLYHLFAGEIDDETLRPKIVSVVRKTIV